VPGTSDNITGKEAALTEDMATLRLVNWASVIFYDIATAAKLWRSKKKICKNPSMHGCLMFLLVSTTLLFLFSNPSRNGTLCT
jgi:hypothetical protein